MSIRNEKRPVHFLHLGDFDNAGRVAWDTIMRDIRQFAPNVDLHFERIAVTEEQIRAMRLPTRPAKKTEGRRQRYNENYSVELDAIAPDVLRQMVRDVLIRFMPEARLAELKAIEAKEREEFQRLIAIARRGLS